jgi:hypothetical protein
MNLLNGPFAFFVIAVEKSGQLVCLLLSGFPPRVASLFQPG